MINKHLIKLTSRSNTVVVMMMIIIIIIIVNMFSGMASMEAVS